MSVQVSFVIATRNRHDVLQWCLRSCLAQEGIEPEILVYDDASEQPVHSVISSDLLKRITLRRCDNNRGQPSVRSLGYREASHDVVMSMDDDAILFDSGIVSDAATLLVNDSQAGAVALRYFERRQHQLSRSTAQQEASDPCYEDADCSSFAGGVVMFRRKAAVECGLYPEWLYRQGEERFLSIRLLDAGYRIVLHGPPSAIHLYSPVRDRRAMNWYGIRNALLFDWICVPHPYFFPYLFKDIIKLFFYKITLSRIPAKLGAIAWGLGSILQKWSLRDPVSRATFKKYLTLPRHGPLPLPPDWSPEPLVKLGIIQDASELDPYLKPRQ